MTIELNTRTMEESHVSFVLIFLLSNNGQEYLLWNGEEGTSYLQVTKVCKYVSISYLY